MENPNTNCLEGMQCPNCESFGPFNIAAEVMCVVHDDGSETFGDHCWTSESYCQCPQCGYEATVAKFSGETAALSSEKKMRRFVESIAALSLWDWDDDQGQPKNECEEPDDGYLDSHQALMNYVEAARLLLKEIDNV